MRYAQESCRSENDLYLTAMKTNRTHTLKGMLSPKRDKPVGRPHDRKKRKRPTPHWHSIPEDMSRRTDSLLLADSRSDQAIRFEIIHHILAPSDLVCGIWEELDFLSDYACSQKAALRLDGKRDVWTLPLIPRTSESRVLNQAFRFLGGQATFRAVRPHVCRLKISVEFTKPHDESEESRLTEHVALLEEMVDQFASRLTLRLQDNVIKQHAIFC